MPELPEVEYARQLAERLLVGRQITEAKCADDSIVFEGVKPQAMRRALLTKRVEAVERHGKYLWFALDKRPWPVFHFGMTGAFRSPSVTPIQLESSGKEPDTTWPPRFAKIHLVTDDGHELVMTNARRLGRILLRDSPVTELPIKALGFDPYKKMPTLTVFKGMLEKRSRTLKGLLLDQGFAAGVGNWIADEVLYQAALDPRRAANSLSGEEIRMLHSKLQSVIHTAVAADADKSRFPKNWLFHKRWGRQKGQMTLNGHPIEHAVVAGRTTAWVPEHQR